MQALIDAMYRERVLLARATPPAEKLLDGPRLFEKQCRVMVDIIREHFPDADEQQVQSILLARIARQRQGEDGDLYHSSPVEMTDQYGELD
jgi:hypothetical protein